MPASFGAGEDYVKSHASRVADVTMAKVITATPDTPLNEIAESLEKNGTAPPYCSRWSSRRNRYISRANLVQVIATSGSKLDIPLSDLTIRDKVLKHPNSQRWAHTALLNVTLAIR
jgi:hypothetical protein